MISIKIEVFVTVNDLKEANKISNDLHEILNDNGITNIVIVTDEISY